MLRMATRDFYVARVCPWAHRPWIVLEELAIPYKQLEIDLKDKDPAFVALYQGGSVVGGGPGPAKVPVLVEHRADGSTFALAESAVISAYLLDMYGDREGQSKEQPAFATHPSAEDKARSAILVDHVGGRIVKGFYGLLMAQEVEAQAAASTDLLAALAGASARSAGRVGAGASLRTTTSSG